MIDINADQGAISFARENDVIKSREFYQRGIRRPAGCDAEGRPLLSVEPEAEAYSDQAPQEQESTALVAASPAPPPQPIDADAAFRRARLSVCVCIVLVLMLTWMVQRRKQVS